MLERIIAAGLIGLTLAGCSTVRQTTTSRTATEELIISTAADRAAQALLQHLPRTGTVYLDTSNFDATDGKYAIGAIQDALLTNGYYVVDDKKQASTVIALRSGALAIDDKEMLVGIPSLNLPIPLTGTVGTPKIALYDNITQLGVAKFAATATDAKTGGLIASTGPQLGLSHAKHHTVMLFFSWDSDDLLPQQPNKLDMLPVTRATGKSS